MEWLKTYSLVYLATPYTKYGKGIEAAFVDAARLTGQLIRDGVKIYSPIVHTHPAAIHGGLDPLDPSIWLPFDVTMMDKADAILIAKMDGWQDSYGVAYEIDVFREANKPIYHLDPETMEVTW